MSKYTVEFRKTQKDETGVSSSYVKRVVDDPRALVEEALRLDSTLEFLAVRKVVEKKSAPAKKQLLTEAPK